MEKNVPVHAPCRAISVQDLRTVVDRVEQQEREGQIPAWDEVASTASIIPLDDVPEPGSVSSSRQWPYVDATEVRLANGMTVTFPLRAGFRVEDSAQ